MNKLYFTNNGFTFKRIDKKQARRAYINGLTVLLSPCNLHPFGVWNTATPANRRTREQYTADEIGVKNDFNNLVNSFEFYNCRDTQTGKYTAFYIPVVNVDRFTGEPSEGGDTVEQYNYKYMEV